MKQQEILMAFKEGKISKAEVLEKLQELKQQPTESPLSEGQKGLWALQKINPDSSAYNIPFCYRIDRIVNQDHVKQACAFLLKQYPILTTIFTEKEGTPCQAFQPGQPLFFEWENISATPSEQVIPHLKKKVQIPFQPEKGPMVRFYLFTKSEQEHYLLINVHHTLFDGSSLTALVTTLMDALQTIEQGEKPTRQPVKTQYRDFVDWERKMLNSEQGEKHRNYWKNQLRGTLPVLELAKDHPKNISGKAEVKTHFTPFPAPLTQQLKAFAERENTTLPTILLATFKLLLHRYTKQEDIIVGMPTLGRPEERFDTTVGYFINMIAIRSGMDEQQLFTNFLKQLQLTMVEGLDHAEYPFPTLVRELKIPRSQSGLPVFQVSFVYQNLPYTLEEKYSIQTIHEVCQEGEYDIGLETLDDDKGLAFNIKYNPTLFLDETIRHMIMHYQQLLVQILYNPNRALNELPMLAGKEREIVLNEWNATEADYPKDHCIHELFEQQARKTPNAIALVFEQQSLTYRELDEKSTSLAIYLQNHGVIPDCPVGICLERSLEMVIGILGILKAGGAYVPLDPDYPTDRLEYMIQDCKAPYVLAQRRFIDKITQWTDQNTQIIALDTNWEQIEQESKQTNSLKRVVKPDNLAYIIYTSGSTGNPKGVMIEHRSLSNFLQSFYDEYNQDFGPDDRILNVTNQSFDVSVAEFFLALSNGASLELIQQETVLEVDKLAEVLIDRKITFTYIPPSILGVVSEYMRRSGKQIALNKLLVGVEPIRKKTLDAFHELNPSIQIINAYGPTETTICSTSYRFNPESTAEKTVPIGTPINNTKIYILSEQNQIQPVGIPGELCIAGEGLARGYLNRPELTAEKFIENPFNPGTKLYKTGDLTRWMADGNIEFLGRIDHQIKIRGFRVELGEIENQLHDYPTIQECIVLVKEREGNKQLIAWYVPKGDDKNKAEIDPKLLRNHLKVKLPDYMVPTAFVKIDAIPMTPNGKVDRKDLLARKITFVKREKSALPQSKTEKIIQKIWKEVLHIDNPGIEDGFFDVGGDSILAVTVTERIREVLNCDISVTTLFTYTNIKELSQFIARQTGQATSNSEEKKEANKTKKIEKTEIATKPENSLPEYYKESLAIIGISCNFPGAKNRIEFWENLINGKESIRFFSKEELNKFDLPEEIQNNPSLVAAQSTIADKDLFDPGFFNISPGDTGYMDPQFRQLLTHSWNAFEDAGYIAKQTSDTAVFMGTTNTSYQALLPNFRGDTPEVMQDTDEYVSWVMAQGGTIPTMISHKLGLKGPSFFVHSNCSSSLIGLYSAFQTLNSGDAKYALVGGATILPFQNLGYLHQPGLNFSSDGHLKTFDAEADGMIAGEGVAVVLLKKAMDAINDEDHIYALLRGIAVNNDGADKVGFYAPSVQGQSAVIQKALNKTAINPETISYVEAHGTGTKLGDPIEFAALTDAYRQYTDKKQFCHIGAVKSNIGHLDTAAGLAGFIKIALSLYHETIPPSINFKNPNPEIDFENSPFRILDRLHSWSKGTTPHRAALSAFGIGGTNTHAILEQYIQPKTETVVPDEFIESTIGTMVPLSARKESNLKEYAQQLLRYLEESEEQEINLNNLAYTLQIGREAMDSRVMFLVKDTSELIKKLQAFVKNEKEIKNCYQGKVEIAKKQKMIQWDKESLKISQWIRAKKRKKLAKLWANGNNFNWKELYRDARYCRISLPTYAFTKDRYWLSEPETKSSDTPGNPEKPKIEVSLTGNVLFQPTWVEQNPARIEETATEYEKQLFFICDSQLIAKEAIESRFKESTCHILPTEEMTVDQRFETGSTLLFETIREILKKRSKGKILFQIVTSTEGESELFAALFGFLKTLQLENPKLIGQLIEIDPKLNREEILEKLEESRRSPNVIRIRYEEGKRWSLDWLELPKAAPQNLPIPWKDKGIYLITGGLGSLGLIFAKDIAQKVENPTLILTGRSPLSETNQNKLKELENLGATVEYRVMDVANKNAVSALIQDINEEYGEIHTILHSAGVILDNYILKKSKKEFQDVLAAKVAGLVNLDEATRFLPPKYLILFSSRTSIFGNTGQADYAIANAFMDSYAKYRNNLVTDKQRQGHTISINWPAWKEGGMQGDEDTEKIVVERWGVAAMENETGIHALYQALESGKDQILVEEGDLEMMKKNMKTITSGIPAKQTNTAPINETKKALSIGEVNPLILQEKTLDRLRAMLGEVIKLSADKVDPNETFQTYGVDSIMVNKLNQQLTPHFEDISKTLFFEYQNLSELTEYLLDDYKEQCITWSGLNNATNTPSSSKPEKDSNNATNTPPSSKSEVEASDSTKPINPNSATNTPPLRGAGGCDSQPENKNSKINKGAQLSPNTSPGKPLTETRSRLSDSNPIEKKNEPIAIIGITGRYPQAKNLKEYWENLKAGKTAIAEIPKERWPLEDFYTPNVEEALTKGKSYTKWGAFLNDITDFDPLFFNIAPSEANTMDPQERLFLQSCWATLEDAGYTKEQLNKKFNRRVGVFAGVTKTGYNLYGPELWKKQKTIYPYTSFSAITNRVSWQLDLQGPSFPIDTMCSASTIAIHEACEQLRRGVCEMAFAGGVNLYMHPSNYVTLCAQNILSTNERCSAFGQGGNGFVPGEGVGTVLLKPLSAAERDQDRIHALIRGSHTNHGGQTNGFTVPSLNAMSDLVTENCEQAGIDPRTISYVESAANGTDLGDPIEVNAIAKAFSRKTKEKRFCGIGSVKPNIGHLESASGISQLTKVVLQLKHKQLVPSIHGEPLNPNLSFKNSPFYLQHTLKPWERPKLEIEGKKQEIPRRAMINSFGAGGSNGNLIVEEYIEPIKESKEETIQPLLIILSAKNADRLRASTKQLLDFIREDREITLLNLAYTLQVGREAMDYRLATVVRTRDELIQALESWMKQDGTTKENTTPLFTGNREPDAPQNNPPKIAQKGDPPESLAKSWAEGDKVQWDSFLAGTTARRISLPTYPFEQRSCRIDQSGGNNTKSSIIDLLAEILDMKPEEIQPESSPERYGLDSILLMQLFQRLKMSVNSSLKLPDLKACETIQQIINLFPTTKELEESKKPEHYPELIHLNSETEGQPIFWFHGAMGGVEVYQELAQISERPFYGIQARGWMTEKGPLHGIPAMANYYVEVIQSLQPHGPYDLGGYSLGGVLAYEVVRLLQAQGERVHTIVMLDAMHTALKEMNFSYKSGVLETINMMLMGTLRQDAEKMAKVKEKPTRIAQTLIHRDRLNAKLDDESFLTQAVTIAKKRGLTKSIDQIRTLVEQGIKVQHAYEVDKIAIHPLPTPNNVHCHFFRNKSGLFFGELEPFFTMSSEEKGLEHVNYWDGWKQEIPNFHQIDVNTSNHMMLLSEPEAKKQIFDYCETLYRRKTR